MPDPNLCPHCDTELTKANVKIKFNITVRPYPPETFRFDRYLCFAEWMQGQLQKTQAHIESVA